MYVEMRVGAVVGKARKKWERDGPLATYRAGRALALDRASRAVAPLVLTRFDLARTEDLIDDHRVTWQVKLDESTVAPDARTPFGVDQSSRGFRNLPRYSYTDQQLFVVPEVELVGPDAIPVIDDDTIVCEAIEPSGEEGYRLKQAVARTLTDRRTITEMISRDPHQELSYACSLVNSWDNYYHWVIEHLPKLRALEYLERNHDVHVELVLPAEPSSYIKESLELLGYSLEDCISWEGGVVSVDNLVQPSFTEPTVPVCRWLKERAESEVDRNGAAPSCSDERIFVSREKARTRKITNRAEVSTVLEEYYIKTYTTEDLRFDEQVELFSRASLIVGVHGAGLTDLIWADDCAIVEIFNDVIKPPYFEIARLLGHDYHCLRGASTADDTYNSDLHVDVPQLRHLLDEIDHPSGGKSN